jgi:hypothetical protein
LFGVGGTTMLIASLAITADLIGNNSVINIILFTLISDKLSLLYFNFPDLLFSSRAELSFLVR